MDTIVIASRKQALRCAVVLAAAMLGGGCLWEDSPAEVTVRGTATGVVERVLLDMRISEGIETLAVTQDGPFAFEWRLEVGASYDVSLTDENTPCTVHQPRSVITRADTAIELTCTGASLASVRVSGGAPAVTLVPGTTQHDMELPLLRLSATVTATVTTEGDTLTIAGAPVASDVPSAPIPLSGVGGDQGDNSARDSGAVYIFTDAVAVSRGAAMGKPAMRPACRGPVRARATRDPPPAMAGACCATCRCCICLSRTCKHERLVHDLPPAHLQARAPGA
jgi:hypothetical protein